MASRRKGNNIQQPDSGSVLFYRIVRGNPPRVSDFLSNTAKGRRPWNDHPETLRLWSGVSVYDDEAVARARARGIPGIGHYMAAVRIEDGGPISYEKTTVDPHHYTLWGDARELQARVLGVTPV